jgi:putative endonuclease
MTSQNWFVYLLLCGDDSIYTGISNDIEKRMKTHKQGKGSKYVARKRFKKLLYTIQAVDKVDAAKMEYRIKQLNRNQKIEFFLHHPELNYNHLKQ